MTRPKPGSIRGLYIAQFFGAFNDNALKLMVALLLGNAYAREVSGALRQDILVANAEYTAKFEEAGVEVIMLDPADIAEARAKAVAAWEKATNGDALAMEMMDTQRILMKDLRLL